MSPTLRSPAPHLLAKPDPPRWNDQPSDRLPEQSCAFSRNSRKAYPLHRFVTHEFPVHEVDKAMAQAFDIDTCMKVVLTPSRA